MAITIDLHGRAALVTAAPPASAAPAQHAYSPGVCPDVDLEAPALGS
jgi:hypothetical protein